MSLMLRQRILRDCILTRYVDPLLLILASRTEIALSSSRMATIKNRVATLDNTVELHPQAQIYNESNDRTQIKVGAHTRIDGILQTFGVDSQIEIGEWCYVGVNSRIWAQSSILIGNHVLISHMVDIHDTNSHPTACQRRRSDERAIRLGQERDLSDIRSAQVVIADDVWIGFKSTILKGVEIGRGAIVGAASVVTKDVPSWTLVAGNPARVVRPITKEERTF